VVVPLERVHGTFVMVRLALAVVKYASLTLTTVEGFSVVLVSSAFLQEEHVATLRPINNIIGVRIEFLMVWKIKTSSF
tara:strand:- start:6056 stop:6289 length:234 start_codon:yes stop_codon:yes gene_type:complete